MKKIDIKALKIMLISAANNLYNHHFEVDKLNVFPVPDGDTGTNMNLTMMNGIKKLDDKEFINMKELAESFSHGLMMGARGNSGVILSQIFRGFFQVLQTKHEKNAVVTNAELVKAWKSAQEYAYRAVLKPVEGTILTVVKDGANFIHEYREINDKDALFIFQKLLEAMKESLKKTPDLLPILKRVGVVDSAGAGLVYIVEGMVYALRHNKPLYAKKRLSQNNVQKLEMVLEQDNFGYCTEVITKLNEVTKLEFDLIKARKDLVAMDGQSIVLVDDEQFVKVHVHTLKPGEILTYFQNFGELLKVKIEDMTEQAKAHIQTIKPKRKLVNDVALIATANGVGMEKFFREELKINNVIKYSTRANPSTGDFLKAIEAVDAKHVFIFPNDKNLLSSAEQAKKIEKKSKVIVIPTRNIAQSMRAVLKYNSELSFKENYKLLCSEIRNVAFGYITIAFSDVEIDGVKIKKQHYFSAMTPRKETTEKIVASSESFSKIVTTLLHKLIFNNAEIITIFVGKKVSQQQTTDVQQILDEDYDIEYEFVTGDQEIYKFLIVVE